MLFVDSGFLPFLAVVVLAVRLTPAAWRWETLLGVSLVFYASFGAPALLAVLLAEAGVAWAAGRALARAPEDEARARPLRRAIVALLAVLVLVRLATHGVAPWGARVGLGSALGVSYFTLQAIAYVVDVYMERVPTVGLGRLASALAFFPKLVQGPIERGPGLLEQLRAPPTPGHDALRSAGLLFLVGLFKKAVVADRLAALVDPVYADPSGFGGWVPVLATYAFAFQLYFDFSGYTDMARATARALGLELGENFRAPYLAGSVSDFWRRWHISFSRWLLDYVFTPLQLAWRRHGRAGTAAALLLTFALSGLWHGTAWTFLVWGLLHGCYLAAEALWRGPSRPGPVGPAARLLGVLVTFHLVTFAWVFFRAPTLGVAGALLTSVVGPARGLDRLVGRLGPQWLVVTLLASLAPALVALARRQPAALQLARHAPLRWAAVLALLLATALLRQDAGTYLYAQF
jgi:D-alanyl-lipoteichoic acid acyltransferase DltB (MBOAT superfamily)